MPVLLLHFELEDNTVPEAVATSVNMWPCHGLSDAWLLVCEQSQTPMKRKDMRSFFKHNKLTKTNQRSIWSVITMPEDWQKRPWICLLLDKVGTDRYGLEPSITFEESRSGALVTWNEKDVVTDKMAAALMKESTKYNLYGDAHEMLMYKLEKLLAF